MERTALRLFLVLSVLSSMFLLSGCRRRAQVHSGIHVVSAGYEAQPRTVSNRHYRNLVRLAADHMQCPAASLVPNEVSPGIFSIEGCGAIREYALVCRRHRACAWTPIAPVEHVAATETTCGATTAQITITGPLTRNVALCGQTLSYALACSEVACGWVRGVASAGAVMQEVPGTSVIMVPEAGASVSVAPPRGAVVEGAVALSADVAQAAQQLILGRLLQVRTCTAGTTVVLRLSWSAQGVISASLAPPHSGSTIEQCIQSAIGSLVLQGVTSPGGVEAQL